MIRFLCLFLLFLIAIGKLVEPVTCSQCALMCFLVAMSTVNPEKKK